LPGGVGHNFVPHEAEATSTGGVLLDCSPVPRIASFATRSRCRTLRRRIRFGLAALSALHVAPGWRHDGVAPRPARFGALFGLEAAAPRSAWLALWSAACRVE